MSEFFGDDDDQTTNIVTKTTKHKDKVIKKDSLDQEIETAKTKINTKKVEQFLKGLKKYKSEFKKQLPDNLLNFFEFALGEKSVNTGTKNKIRRFIDDHKVEEKPEYVEQPIIIEQPKLKELTDEELDAEFNNKVMAVTKKPDDVEFLKLFELAKRDNEKVKVHLSMLQWKLSDIKDLPGIVELIKKLLFLNEVEIKFCNINLSFGFMRSMDKYLENIIGKVTPEHFDLLTGLFNQLTSLNDGKVNKRILEFEFFCKDEIEETEDEVFKLVFLTRKKNYELARDYYLANEAKYEGEYSYLRKIKHEFGISCFKAKDFSFAFKILQKSYFDGFKVENYLFILCVLLDMTVLDEPFFDVFIDNLKLLEKNPYLLKAWDRKEEIFRAYFYLTMFDYEKSCAILEELEPDLECMGLLKLNVEKRLMRKIVGSY